MDGPGWDQTFEDELIQQQLAPLQIERDYRSEQLAIEIEYGGDKATVAKWRKSLLDIEAEMMAIRQTGSRRIAAKQDSGHGRGRSAVHAGWSAVRQGAVGGLLSGP